MEKRRDNVVMDKSYAFALEVIEIYKFLIKEQKEFVLSRQLLRSGTAIGALIKEAEHAQSKADFLNKMNVALKEANETDYWLDLLKDAELLSDERIIKTKENVKSIIRLLASIVKTTKNSLGKS